MCGGTTGREGLPGVALPGSDATTFADVVEGHASDDAAAQDQTTSVYTGEFDVAITYLDRVLPDVQPAREGGTTEAGNGLPDCPPFLGVDGYGNVLPIDRIDGGVINEVPSDWTGDGGLTLAADGGACATYPWLTSVAADECLEYSNFGTLFPNAADLPPCNWAVGAGAATQGPQAGRSRYDLCIELYQCFLRTRCFLVDPTTTAAGCFCGVPTADPRCYTNPQGGCVQEEMGVLELPGTAASQAQYVLQHFADTTPGVVGWVGHFLNEIFAQVSSPSSLCFDAGSE
jgi:hypothetical protein